MKHLFTIIGWSDIIRVMTCSNSNRLLNSYMYAGQTKEIEERNIPGSL